MSVTLDHIQRADEPAIATTIRNAGLAGAGGAGFPTYAKWERLDEAPFLLVNHQESEPNYYIDKWLGKNHPEVFAEFFDALLEETFDVIVVCAKHTDRKEWMRPLEAVTDATVYTPDDLPLDATAESGVVMAYTEDKYEFGMESVLMRIVADVAMRDELPMDHGWIVQNTETMFNLYHTLDDGETMTHKLVHVDGNVPSHRFFEVPVGTPASALLEAAGRPPSTLTEDEQLADGGPGWCFGVNDSPEAFGVSKRTNCVLVLDEDVVAENTLGNDRINVLNTRDWTGDHETEPTRLSPETVRIPLITNSSLTPIVDRSRPVVEEGQSVSAGEMIAVPGEGDVSNTQHASIAGTVTNITDDYVEIIKQEEEKSAAGERESLPTTLDHEYMVYWTWCDDCGAYIARPELDHLGHKLTYVCQDCR